MTYDNQNDPHQPQQQHNNMIPPPKSPTSKTTALFRRSRTMPTLTENEPKLFDQHHHHHPPNHHHHHTNSSRLLLSPRLSPRVLSPKRSNPSNNNSSDGSHHRIINSPPMNDHEDDHHQQHHQNSTWPTSPAAATMSTAASSSSPIDAIPPPPSSSSWQIPPFSKDRGGGGGCGDGAMTAMTTDTPQKSPRHSTSSSLLSSSSWNATTTTRSSSASPLYHTATATTKRAPGGGTARTTAMTNSTSSLGGDTTQSEDTDDHSSSSLTSPTTSVSLHPSSRLSVAKTLTRLMTIPTNRSCADCKTTLVDSSQVYISISPIIPTNHHHYDYYNNDHTTAIGLPPKNRHHAPKQQQQQHLHHHHPSPQQQQHDRRRELLRSIEQPQQEEQPPSTNTSSNGNNNNNNNSSRRHDNHDFMSHHEAFAPPPPSSPSSSTPNRKQRGIIALPESPASSIAPPPPPPPLVVPSSPDGSKLVPGHESSSFDQQQQQQQQQQHDHHHTTASSQNDGGGSSMMMMTIDPALLASKYISGHGVFVCALCGAVHKLLGSHVALVHSAVDPNAWNVENIQILIQSGGNARATKVLEAYLSTRFNDTFRPKSNSTIADRLTFVRAKYQALAFILPPSLGPLASMAWEQIVRINHPMVWGNDGWATNLALASLPQLEFSSVVSRATFQRGTSRGSNNNSPHHQHDSGDFLQASGDFGSSDYHHHPHHHSHLLGTTTTNNTTMSSSSSNTRQRSAELPDRLVDHFCVVTAADALDYVMINEQKGRRMKKQPHVPEDILLRPIVTDCYPAPSTYEEDECFPEHVATFVFPDGCRPSSIQLPPSFYTFVLTNSTGDRLYGSVLRLYDRIRDLDWLRKVFRNHAEDWGEILPDWLLTTTDYDYQSDDEIIMSSSYRNIAESTTMITTDHHHNRSPRNHARFRRSVPSVANSDVLFLPRCLVVLSHHPFFDVFRKFLLQLYRITLVEAPLPIERFVANFVREVPLPPPGKVQIKCGFTLDDAWIIERPPENQLPMINFSYQPLFTTLSVSNILVVMGCLLQEHRIVLLSKYPSVLSPIAEALLSLLFPFHWQGMYLPIMPYTMLDILDAPVPYLVGLNAKYLHDVPIDKRPSGVVFVDVDNDVVHLGYEDRGNPPLPRQPPCFPERQIGKLKQKLIEYGSSVYLPPDNPLVGGKIISGADHMISSSSPTAIPTATSTTNIITTGSSSFPFERRDSSALFSYLSPDSSHHNHHNNNANHHQYYYYRGKFRRKDVFITTDKAYKENELIVPITGFLSEQGQFSGHNIMTSSTSSSGRTIHSVHSSASMSGTNNSNKNLDHYSHRSVMTSGSTSSSSKLITGKLPTIFTRQLFRQPSRGVARTNSNPGSPVSHSSMSTTTVNHHHNDVIHLLEMNEPPGFNVHEIRQAFLRFFVSLLQNYRDYIDKDGGFKSNDFLTYCAFNVSCNAIPFIQTMISTQMFQSFIDERKHYTNDSEVLFFDESIMAKQNRSAKKAISNITSGRTIKRTTSFLNDKTSLITNTYTPPPPSNWGLPDDGRTYCYSSFPKLDPALFGKIRPPMKWSRSRTMRQRVMSRRAVAAKNEQNLVLKALIMPAQKSQEIAKNVTKAGATQLEAAIKALSAAFATPRPPPSKSSSDNNSSNHVRRGSNSSIVSDITLPSTFDFTSDVASTAEEIVMNARRKQAVLIGIMIKVQAQWRVQLAKQELLDRKRHSTPQSPDAGAGGVPSRSYFSMKRMLRAAVRMQTWLRRSRIRTAFLRCRCAAITIQKNFRCRRIRIGYVVLVGVMTRCQAILRGRKVRRGLSMLIRDRMVFYRTQLFTLWKETHTPLSYRTKYWTVMNQDNIFSLSLAERELNRMWECLKISYQIEADAESHLTTSMIMLNTLGMVDIHFRKAMKISENIANGTVKFTNSRSRMKARLSKTWTDANRVEAERLQIYEKVSLHDVEEVIEEYYGLFSIATKKNRKSALAEAIWCHFDDADASVIFMHSMFPELNDGTNIIFMPPSKKAIRRFPTADPQPQPLYGDMLVELIVARIIRHNVALVADISLRIVPKLMNRLSDKHEKSREWMTTWSRKLDAVRMVHHLDNKREAGFYLIKKLLEASSTSTSTGVSFTAKTHASLQKIIANPLANRVATNPFDRPNDDSFRPTTTSHDPYHERNNPFDEDEC